MSEGLLSKVKTQQEKVKELFDRLSKERESLMEKRSELDRKLTEVNTEQLRLQGDYRALENLLKEDDVKDDKSDTVH